MWLKLYKTYIKPSLMYDCEAWRPCTKEGLNNTSFASRIQDLWNYLEDQVKLSKNQKAFRRAYRKSKNLYIEHQLPNNWTGKHVDNRPSTD